MFWVQKPRCRGFYQPVPYLILWGTEACVNFSSCRVPQKLNFDGEIVKNRILMYEMLDIARLTFYRLFILKSEVLAPTEGWQIRVRVNFLDVLGSSHVLMTKEKISVFLIYIYIYTSRWRAASGGPDG